MNFVTNYNDLEHRKPWFIKRWARSVTLDGLNFLNGFGAGNRLSLSIPRIQFLFFHHVFEDEVDSFENLITCLLYTSPSPRDATLSRMPSSA